MKFKNYIWDFDGTLFDSYPHMFAAFKKVMTERGLAASLDFDMCERYLHVSFAELKKYSAVSEDAFSEFVRYHHLTENSGIEPDIVPFGDCEAVLIAVKEAGGRNFLYTHRNETVFYYLEKFGMLGYFDGFVTDLDGFPLKPDPSAILHIIEKYSLVHEESIMIGDREIDGLAGVNAGIAGALVCYPPALPSGECPASCTSLSCTAPTLSEFASQMGLSLKN